VTHFTVATGKVIQSPTIGNGDHTSGGTERNIYLENFLGLGLTPSSASTTTSIWTRMSMLVTATVSSAMATPLRSESSLG
jgi:hypothetical protein